MSVMIDYFDYMRLNVVILDRTSLVSSVTFPIREKGELSERCGIRYHSEHHYVSAEPLRTWNFNFDEYLIFHNKNICPYCLRQSILVRGHMRRAGILVDSDEFARIASISGWEKDEFIPWVLRWKGDQAFRGTGIKGKEDTMSPRDFKRILNYWERQSNDI